MVIGVPLPKVGVLGLQGDFARHRASLEALGVEPQLVRLPGDLGGLDALVLPGGESTTMIKLMDGNGLRGPLTEFARARPVLGTCAGVILLAKEAGNLPGPPLGVMDLEVERNAYGRQIDSFSAELDAPSVGGRYLGVFIRAPRLTRLGSSVEIVAHRLPRDGSTGEPVGVRQGRAVGLCFHPELTSDLRFHRWFLTVVAGLELPSGGGPVASPGSSAAAAGVKVR